MSLNEIYSDIIIDYSRNPKFKRVLNNSEHSHSKNLSCGDEIDIYIKIEDSIIKDISYEGKGCIISSSSAAMMCETLKGRRYDEALKIIENVLKMSHKEPYDEELIEDIQVFSDISKYPMRVKCFTLSWHTADDILRSWKKV
ncbi:MAG TPA: SUF system NifU family Fe-S cluster assembly protein [Petrotogaceae bacterium]|nr:SUF system NifU family Fe-S cluster assembly protein [Petrotogaceae bacterium]HNY36786.1 SUF system NifU family Fe-S cluster assembly protein [Petrotogaceae bacterium]HOG33883.1 SUF system NifU family Fe-S cluster assembly protein [Petrotogaceae bacterium]HPA93094.1 SUF system NifU family Fe-S cluster assembly protein [Petrotogaceae bacterium]HPO26906.1 SUF system NifU family Fe-S cluster assembly protein [Petrotogaceae bacterium]